MRVQQLELRLSELNHKKDQQVPAERALWERDRDDGWADGQGHCQPGRNKTGRIMTRRTMKERKEEVEMVEGGNTRNGVEVAKRA